jgi:hypothetical protein
VARQARSDRPAHDLDVHLSRTCSATCRRTILWKQLTPHVSVAAQRGRDPQIYLVMNISNGRDALRGLAT